MQPLKITITGDFWDCQIYRGRLYLWSLNGELKVFNPSGTSHAKHWICDTSRMDHSGGVGYNNRFQTAGYFNTTSAIDEIQFKMASGNIDSGTFKLYGVL